MSLAGSIDMAAAALGAARPGARAVDALGELSRSPRAHVLWVPGTNERGVPAAFARATREMLGVEPVAVAYEGSWNLRSSVHDGIAATEAALQALRGSSNDAPVYLAGESQGAWVIGEVLADGAHDDLVKRAILIGHPQIAPTHYPTAGSHIIELNHPRDAVTVPLRGEPDRIRSAFEDLVDGRRRPRAAATLAATALRNPRYLALTALGECYRIPRLAARLPNYHDYTAAMPDAVRFLATGTPPAAL